MSQPYFQFKQFIAWCGKYAMKAGTDGVLLRAWTPVKSSVRILGTGTNTGLVALMLAQCNTVPTMTLEIDEAAAAQTIESVNRSPQKNRIEVIQRGFKHYSSRSGIFKFNTIVSSPPYFSALLKCSDEQRNKARHNDNLTYEELLADVPGLLSQEGTLIIVIPMGVGERTETLAYKYGLYPLRQLSIIAKLGGTPKQALISFGFTKRTCEAEKLLTETSYHQYSEEYIELTRDFYLKM